MFLLAAGLFLFNHLTGVEGGCVKVVVDGAAYREYPLDEDCEVTIENLPTGRLTLRISDGSVDVAQSSCPDLLCVKHRRIRRAGESIICLPNRVAIEVLGTASVTPDPDAPDAVTR